jgi:hypothetical protein
MDVLVAREIEHIITDANSKSTLFHEYTGIGYGKHANYKLMEL